MVYGFGKKPENETSKCKAISSAKYCNISTSVIFSEKLNIKAITIPPRIKLVKKRIQPLFWVVEKYKLIDRNKTKQSEQHMMIFV